MFESHTVADNILLALKGARATASSLFGWRNRVPARAHRRHLDDGRTLAHRERMAANLSHGQKQWLEIGMLLAQDPKLLLVDEPVAGMTDAETEADGGAPRDDRPRPHGSSSSSTTWPSCAQLDCKVTCLHEGAVLAEGSIDAVSANERVIEVYLGR